MLSTSEVQKKDVSILHPVLAREFTIQRQRQQGIEEPCRSWETGGALRKHRHSLEYNLLGSI